jgi:hypothetical protein
MMLTRTINNVMIDDDSDEDGLTTNIIVVVHNNNLVFRRGQRSGVDGSARHTTQSMIR